MKKISLCLFSFILLVGISFSADLSFTPDRAEIGSNCIVKVDIVLKNNNHQLLGSDMLIETNMEFVDYVPTTLFKNTLPPVVEDNGIIRLGMFSFVNDAVLSNSGVIGKLYLKMSSNLKEGSINFLNNGMGDYSDTNLYIKGAEDVFENSDDAYYTLSSESCVHDMIIEGGFAGKTYDEALSDLQNSIIENNKGMIMKFWIYNNIFWLLLGLGIILFGVILFIRKKNKTSK